MSNSKGKPKEKPEEKSEKKFFETLPGVITAIATLITAIAGCIAIFFSPQILDRLFPPTSISATPTQDPSLSAIDEKYVSLGSEGGFLGASIGPEQSTSDGFGTFRNFNGGSIYWTSETGAHEVHGEIYAKWAMLGREKSFLGYPTTDETIAPDGIG
jgi:hypothetical protein